MGLVLIAVLAVLLLACVAAALWLVRNRRDWELELMYLTRHQRQAAAGRAVPGTPQAAPLPDLKPTRRNVREQTLQTEHRRRRQAEILERQVPAARAAKPPFTVTAPTPNRDGMDLTAHIGEKDFDDLPLFAAGKTQVPAPIQAPQTPSEAETQSPAGFAPVPPLEPSATASPDLSPNQSVNDAAAAEPNAGELAAAHILAAAQSLPEAATVPQSDPSPVGTPRPDSAVAAADPADNPMPEADAAEPQAPPAKTPAPDLPVITLEEATRFMGRSGAPKAAAPELETIILPERPSRKSRLAAPAVPRETITLERLPVRRKLDVYLEEAAKDSSRLLKPAAPPKAESSTIEPEDIRAHLLRQRLARRREIPLNSEANAQLSVIPAEEVLANLAGTDSPVNQQRHRKTARTVVRESVIPSAARVVGTLGHRVPPPAPVPVPLVQPLSTRFTPFEMPNPEPHPSEAPVAASSLETSGYATPAPMHWGVSTSATPDPTAMPTPGISAQVLAPHEAEAEWVKALNELGSAAAAPAYTPPPAADTMAPGNDWRREFFEEQKRRSLGGRAVKSGFQGAAAHGNAWQQSAPTASESADEDAESHTERLSADSSAPSAPYLSQVDTGAPAPWVQAAPAWVPGSFRQPEAVVPAQPADADADEDNDLATDPFPPGVNDWPLPELALLAPPQYNPEAAQSEETLLEKGITIEEKLAEFKVKVNVLDAYAGPVITRYEIEPATGVRGNQVVNLEKDLARALGCTSIRVVETIPGKTCMGLELPNPKRQMIRLSEILSAPAFLDSRSKLTLALGQDIIGQPIVTDLAKAPHLLVAGTTGSGKSVGVNAMILSMLFKATPEEVRLIMIDPKMLELSIYEGIPHLLAPVVTDMKLAANALTWCVNEMEKRYRLMSHVGVRNLAGYNQKVLEARERGRPLANPFSLTPETPERLDKLPFIVVIVDEFADLMMTAGKKIEELIARLAQKARAAGIHLILATQRPSVDVITGLIKANIPTRIAFQVSSKVDSRTILDQMGAENLLGQGDMLFLPPGTGYPQRVHGAFVADEEVHRVAEYWKSQGEPDYVDDILTAGVGEDDLFSNANGGRNNDGEADPLYDEAVAFVVRSGKASISAVQRQLRIGYNRAARLVEQMEQSGIVSAPEHNGNRSVLIPQREV